MRKRPQIVVFYEYSYATNVRVLHFPNIKDIFPFSYSFCLFLYSMTAKVIEFFINHCEIQLKKKKNKIKHVAAKKTSDQ